MITLKNISKIYTSHNKKTIALDNINITLANTGLITITGRSGSGKTTLVNILASLDNQTQGEIITNYQDEQYSTIIFQDAQLIAEYTVYQNLKLIMDLFGMVDENKLNELLIKYDLLDLKDNLMNEISGGQKQRVAIVRAILSSKPVIICDEPTSSLDEENAKIVVEDLKKLSKNKLIIVVTHELEFFKEYSDRIIELKNGSIINDTILNEVNNNGEAFKYNKIENNLKSILSLSFFNINKNKIRTIILILTLFISFLGFSFAVNLSFSSANSMKAKIYNDEKVEVLNIIKTKDGHPIDSMLDEDYEKISKYSGMKTIETSIPLYYGDNNKFINFSGAYISNNSPFNVIYGSQVVNDNEILISKTMVKYLMETLNVDSYQNLLGYNKYSIIVGTNVVNNDLLNTKKINVRISGIYETKNENKNDNEKMEYIICNEQILSVKTKLDIDTFYVENNNGYSSVIMGNSSEYVKNTIKSYPLIGELASNKNEVVISSIVAFELTKNPNYLNNNYVDHDSIIGTTIQLKLLSLSYLEANFPNKFDSLKNRNTTTLSLKIVGITKGTTEYIISNGLYDEIYTVFSFENIKYGFGYTGKITSTAITNFERKGYTDYSVYKEAIEDDIELLKSLSIIAYIVGSAFMIVGIFVSINYVSNSIKKKKSIIGILSSFGVEKKRLIKIIFIDIFIYLIGVMMLVSIIQLPLISIINNFMQGKGILQFKLLSYNIISIVFIVLLIMVWIAIYYLICSMKIMKSSKIDLVYDR